MTDVRNQTTDQSKSDSRHDESDEKGQVIYNGQGTEFEPYLVEFLPGDLTNPMNFPFWRKWLITSIVTMTVFAVTLTSSAYSSSAEAIQKDFDSSSELFAAGIALYVLGFAVGPPIWAPLSELFGRRATFISSLFIGTAFVGASAGCKNMASLLVFRFISGACSASPLTNAGGVIADIFPIKQRGLAMSLFSSAPFLGPTLGPTLGGFVTITIGWRWVQGICCIFIGVLWIAGILLVPETYGPILLQRRAKRLNRNSGPFYVSILEKNSGKVQLSALLRKAVIRPWVLLFREPIVLIASLYLAILYGTIYAFLPAFSIIFHEDRGWNAGVSGLAFLGLVVGMLVGLVYLIWDDRKRYQHLASPAAPEARLPPAMVGAVAIPIGMFGFAWTNSPSIHWSVSIILSAPFGFGVVQVFVTILVYLLDSYTIYAASVLGATAMLRAFVGAAFPLFTTQMYDALGIHWATSLPAFLTVICMPFPFVMYRYGDKIRMKCKYAHEAAVLMEKMQASGKSTQK